MARTPLTDLMARLGFRTGAEANFVELYNAVDLVNYNLVTGAATAVFGQVNFCTGTSADYTLTLPTAVGNAGKMICVKLNSDATLMSKVVTVDGAGTEKIGIDLTRSLAAGGYLTIVARVTSGVGFWDVISLDQGAWIAWTPGIGSPGFSANPTNVAGLYYKGVKNVKIRISMTAGTSNNAAFTITGIPSDIVPKLAYRRPQIVFDNNLRKTGSAVIAAAGTTITLLMGDAGSFTTSAGKGIEDLFMDYEI